jgi:poly-gamma-glutamate capsule biosynthesis protein CapA/YwtB (metallophosphatase superfamily)
MKAKKFDLFNRISTPISYFRAPTSFSNVKEDSIPEKYINLDGFRLMEEPADRIKLTFLGDMMGVGLRHIDLSKKLLDRINDSDYTIINLSSVLTNDHSMVLERQHTHPQVFLSLCDQLPMNKVIFSIANNHILDYGKNGLQNTLLQLRRAGATVIGLKSNCSMELKEGLQIKASTCWYTEKDIVNTINNQKSNLSTIHYLHWGDEYKIAPTKAQIDHIKSLSDNDLMVCGHHSHCPQPIKMINDKLSAFSLGNFTTCHDSSKINSGIVLTTDLVKFDKWELEQVNWKFLDISATDRVLVQEL